MDYNYFSDGITFYQKIFDKSQFMETIILINY